MKWGLTGWNRHRQSNNSPAIHGDRWGIIPADAKHFTLVAASSLSILERGKLSDFRKPGPHYCLFSFPDCQKMILSPQACKACLPTTQKIGGHYANSVPWSFHGPASVKGCWFQAVIWALTDTSQSAGTEQQSTENATIKQTVPTPQRCTHRRNRWGSRETDRDM